MRVFKLSMSGVGDRKVRFWMLGKGHTSPKMLMLTGLVLLAEEQRHEGDTLVDSIERLVLRHLVDMGVRSQQALGKILSMSQARTNYRMKRYGLRACDRAELNNVG